MELQTIRSNIVQAIRAYRVDDLMKAAPKPEAPKAVTAKPKAAAKAPAKAKAPARAKAPAKPKATKAS